MKQEIIRLDQLTMGTIKYSDITLIQEKETEIISSDSLWRGIHEYYNGLVKSNIGNGKKVILQIHSKKEFILLFMALIRTGACPIILPVSMTKNSANMLQKICSDNQDAIIMADDMGKVCVQTLLPDIKLPLLSIKEFVCQDENIETDYNDFSDNIADDVAFVIYSSGSTSEPKGVMVTHKGVRGYLGPIIWEGFFPEISNNENSKGYLFHPTIQTVDGEANYDCYINTVYSNSLASEIKKTERYIKRQENVASKMQQQILNIRCSQELLSKLNFSLKCKKEYHPLLLEELLDLRTESEIENIFDNFSQEYIQYSVEMRKKILAQTILFYMNKKGVLLKDIPCTLNQILKCLSVNTDNNDIIYRWIELLKKYNYVTETDGIYVCKIEIYEKGLKYGWEEVEYLWKGKLESPLVLDYIINNIKNWDKLIQKEQQATLLLFEQGEDIYADALYKETKILQYLNHSLSKKVLGYLYENANATILEIGAGTGATSDKVLSDIRENKFEEHIVYFYTDISRFFLQRAKERYKECDGKIEMHYQTLDIDEAFSSQLPSNFQADIVIAVGVLNNSVNTDKCIYEINSVMKPGGILLIIETVEDVPDILITQSFMMTEPKDQRKATNTMFLNRKQWLEILEENGFCNSEEFPGYGEYLEVLGQKLFYCTKE